MTRAHTVEVRFFGSTKEFEAALAKMGVASDVAANDIGKKMEAGAGKAGNAFQAMGQKLEQSGVVGGAALTKFGDRFSEVEGKGKNFSGAMAEVGKGLTLGIGAAAVAVGVEAFKLGSQWQTAMASLAGHAGIGITAADKIGSAFETTAFKSEFSATAMASAYAPVAGEFGNLEGHALSAKEALSVMSAASDLATASGGSLTDTTKALADVMLPFHMNAKQAANAANILWNTQRLLGVSTSDLSGVYQRLTPFVAGSGMTLGQLSGMMVELSHSLGGGRQAARIAGRAIQGLIDPSSAANKALDKMGISLFNTQGKFIGMPAAIGKLKAGLDSLPGASAGVAAEQKVLALTQEAATLKAGAQTTAVKAQEKAISAQLPSLKLQAGALTKSSAMQAIFGTNANAMLAVIAGGPAVFNKSTAAVEKHRKLEHAASQMSKTWHVQSKVLMSGLEDLGMKIGSKLVPMVQHLGMDVGKVVGWFEKHKAAAKALAIVVGGILVSAMSAFAVQSGVKAFNAVKNLAGGVAKLGSALLEKIVGTSGAVTAAFSEDGAAAEEAGAASETAFGPIGLIIGGIVIAGYELVTHWKTIAKWISEVWHGVLGVAKTIWHAISGFFKAWWPVVLGIMTGGALLIPALLIKYWHTVYTDAVTAWDTVITFFTGIPSKLLSALSHLGELLLGWITEAWHGLTSWLATAWDAELAWWESIPGRIISALAALGSLLSGWISKAWSALVSALTAAVRGMESFVTGIPGTILGWFGDAGSMLVQWGKDLINGLVNGIKSVAGDIGGAIKGVFDSLPGVSLLKKIPGLSWLAEGGLITKPTLAVVGEAGPELVLPLSKVAPMLSKPMRLPTSFAAVASMTGKAVLPPSASSGLGYGAAGTSAGGSGITINVTHGPMTVTGLPQQIAGQVQSQLDAHDADLMRHIQQALVP